MTERILIYRLGSLGDNLLGLPAFRKIRSAHPDAHITFLTNVPINAKAAPIAAILEHTGLCDEVIEYPVGLRNSVRLLKLGSQLRAGRYTVMYHLTAPRGLLSSIRDFLFFRAVCGVRRVIGVPFRKKDLVCSYDRRLHRFEWEAERLKRRVSALGEVDLMDERSWSLNLTSGERSQVTSLLSEKGLTGRFIVASVGTKCSSKDWTDPNWAAMLQQLSAKAGSHTLVFIGAANEYDRSAALLKNWTGNAINLCGVTNVRQSAVLLELCDVFIGHDSGPMHLAATVGTPCVIVFSAQGLPGQWWPRGTQHTIFYNLPPCYGCRLEVCTKYNTKCITSIPPADVASAVVKYLK
jgi:heptosyltransferase III